MNGKQRLVAALAGKKSDRVPFAPNIWQWYQANDYNGTLPVEAAEAGSPVAVLRNLGVDIFSKFDSPRPAARLPQLRLPLRVCRRTAQGPGAVDPLATRSAAASSATSRSRRRMAR